MITSPGEAEAILAKAKATAEGLALVSKTLKDTGGVEVRPSIPAIGCWSRPLGISQAYLGLWLPFKRVHNFCLCAIFFCKMPIPVQELLFVLAGI